MKIDYNLLWFEDSDAYVDSLKPRIGAYLEEFGFVPNITVRPNGKEVKELIDDNDFDLILMDYHLNVGKYGDENGNILIKRIRDHALYTEIVFYSGHSGFEDAIEKRLEGVFFSDKGGLFEKTKKIINLTIKKNQDINNLRGLFIAEAIDLAKLLDEIITIHLKIINEKTDFFKDRILDEEFFTDYQKTRLINKMLDEEIVFLNEKIQETTLKDEIRKLQDNKIKIKDSKKVFGKIIEEVIQIRNHLAHSKPSVDKKNTLICRIAGKKELVEFNGRKCKKIRQDFRKHSDNLNQIREILHNL